MEMPKTSQKWPQGFDALMRGFFRLFNTELQWIAKVSWKRIFFFHTSVDVTYGLT